MFVGPQAPLVAFSAAQDPGQPEGACPVCHFSYPPSPQQLLDLYSPWFFICFLHALTHGWSRKLSSLGLPCPHFIIFIVFADCTPHPTLTTAWPPNHHLFCKHLSSTYNVPSIAWDSRATTRTLPAFKELSHPTLPVSLCILSSVNLSYLISLLPLLISCLENISKCGVGKRQDRKIL